MDVFNNREENKTAEGDIAPHLSQSLCPRLIFIIAISGGGWWVLEYASI